jgi:hypothetical protein
VKVERNYQLFRFIDVLVYFGVFPIATGIPISILSLECGTLKLRTFDIGKEIGIAYL